MSNSPTPNMGLVLPTDQGDVDVWGVLLDTALGLVDSHNHTTGQGVKVPTGGLSINADLSFSPTGTPAAATDLKAIDFAGVATTVVASYAGALFLNSADNELYWRTTAGANVKVTNGAALNVAGFTGGIGGDYSAVGALVQYDDATRRYLMQQEGSPRPWAGVAMGNLDIYQQAASITNRVRLKSPNALAASYDLTFFAALPANTQAMTIDTSGNIGLGQGFTLSANNSITISGTGTYKHGVKTINKALFSTNVISASAGSVSNTGGLAGITLANNTIAYIPLPELPQHCRISAVSLYFNSAADRNNCSAVLFTTSNADPATTAFTTTSIPLTASGTALLRAAVVNLTPSGSQTFWVQVSNSTSTPKIQAITVDFDVP